MIVDVISFSDFELLVCDVTFRDESIYTLVYHTAWVRVSLEDRYYFLDFRHEERKR